MHPELSTPGFDARFPNTNQSKNCFQNYIDYYRCVDAKGEEFEPCNQFKKAFTSLCPTKWVIFLHFFYFLLVWMVAHSIYVIQIETWDQQREDNTFPPLREDYRLRAHFSRQ